MPIIRTLSEHADLAFLELAPSKPEVCHLARIQGPEGPFEGFVKICDGQGRELINEIIGYLLADAVGLPQPWAAYILDAPVGALAQAHPKQVWGHLSTFPVWCTEGIPGRPPKLLYIGEHLEALAPSLRRWRALPAAAAFDHWVANVDRNTGNLIRTGKDDYALIDHGHVLGGGCLVG